MPRQDALTDQMFDVMSVLSSDEDSGFDGRRIAAWLLRTFFKSTVLITASFYTSNKMPLTSAEFHYARHISTNLGCYDAGDWLRRQAEQLQAVI